MEEKYNNLFIGTIIGIVLILGIGWYVKSTKPLPTLPDCLRACEKASDSWQVNQFGAHERITYDEAWLKECENACFKKYRIK